MADHLALYLHDHLAGAAFAVQLLDELREHAADGDASRLSAELLVHVEADRCALQRLLDQVGGERNVVKEAVAWIAEKAGRLKFTVKEPMGTFEAIEALSLGVRGKLALWNALRAVRAQDRRLDGLNLEELAMRADSQFEQLESLRLRLAQIALVRN
jgi:hypothetical protein